MVWFLFPSHFFVVLFFFSFLSLDSSQSNKFDLIWTGDLLQPNVESMVFIVIFVCLFVSDWSSFSSFARKNSQERFVFLFCCIDRLIQSTESSIADREAASENDGLIAHAARSDLSVIGLLMIRDRDRSLLNWLIHGGLNWLKLTFGFIV